MSSVGCRLGLLTIRIDFHRIASFPSELVGFYHLAPTDSLDGLGAVSVFRVVMNPNARLRCLPSRSIAHARGKAGEAIGLTIRTGISAFRGLWRL